MTLSADLLRGYTDGIILRRLAEGDSYGYAVNAGVERASGGAFEMKEATLYTAFTRMEKAGFITSYWGDAQGGPRRRYYHITDAGQAKLSADRAMWQETRALIDILLEGGTPNE